MSVSLPGAAESQPNMTPILDMVFQLITFFMLVITFKTESLEQGLKLPVIGSARPVDTQGHDEVLVLNIRSDGQLVLYGQPKDLESYVAAEAQASLQAARRTVANFRIGDELPTTVVIRADRTTPFKLLNRVMKTCQEHGFRRFSLNAMNKQEG